MSKRLKDGYFSVKRKVDWRGYSTLGWDIIILGHRGIESELLKPMILPYDWQHPWPPAILMCTNGSYGFDMVVGPHIRSLLWAKTVHVMRRFDCTYKRFCVLDKRDPQVTTAFNTKPWSNEWILGTWNSRKSPCQHEEWDSWVMLPTCCSWIDPFQVVDPIINTPGAVLKHPQSWSF